MGLDPDDGYDLPATIDLTDRQIAHLKGTQPGEQLHGHQSPGADRTTANGSDEGGFLIMT